MTRIGRYNLAEFPLGRVLSGAIRRLTDIPHILTWKFSPRAKRNRRRLRGFQGRHAGERCFIVATGPSLASTNLDLLADEITFGLNRIYLAFENTTFRPTYYVAVDELVLELFANEIRQLEMPKFLNWNRRKFYPAGGAGYHFLKSRMVFKDSFQQDVCRPVVTGGTVTFVALQIAYYMGFKTAIVVGLDHNYGQKKAPRSPDERDTIHFHPGYLPVGFNWRPDKLRSEMDYEIARAAYEADGREILDATIDGECRVFKKTDYLSLFPKAVQIAG